MFTYCSVADPDYFDSDPDQTLHFYTATDPGILPYEVKKLSSNLTEYHLILMLVLHFRTVSGRICNEFKEGLGVIRWI
jgi:hypothetical protein